MRHLKSGCRERTGTASQAVVWAAMLTIGACCLGVGFYFFGIWAPVTAFAVVAAIFLIAG
jgi:hypothetical protein